MSENRSEYKLKNGPDDGISAVRFGPTSSQFLLASSWDSHVRLYDVVSNSLRLKYSHGGRPVLSCAFQDPIHVWSGGKNNLGKFWSKRQLIFGQERPLHDIMFLLIGLDGELKTFDINSATDSSVGQHDNAIRCVEYSNDVNAVKFHP